MSPTASAEETWLTISEAAKELDIHPRTLRRYINDDRFEVVRLSPQVVRVRPEDIEAFQLREAKIKTGTGTCYVPRPEPEAEVSGEHHQDHVHVPAPDRRPPEDDLQEQLAVEITPPKPKSAGRAKPMIGSF